MKYLFLLLFAVTNLQAQLSSEIKSSNNQRLKAANVEKTILKFKNSPNIIWMGEIMMDYWIDNGVLSTRKSEKKVLKALDLTDKFKKKLLKVQISNPDESIGATAPFVNKIMQELIQFPIYADENLLNPVSLKSQRYIGVGDGYGVDKIYFDANASMDNNTADNKVGLSNIKLFRVRQLLIYDKTTTSFQVIPLAIAPMATHINNPLITTETVLPLFWCAPAIFSDLLDLNNAKFHFAIRTSNTCNISKVAILKESHSFSNAVDSMLENIREQYDQVHLGAPGSTVYDYSDGTQLLDGIFIKNIGLPYSDDLTKFDSESVWEHLLGEHVTEIELLQDWAWNQQTKQLEIRFVGFLLKEAVLTSSGDVSHQKNIFIRRPDLDYKIRSKSK